MFAYLVVASSSCSHALRLMLLQLLLLQLLAASTRADNLGATLNIYYEATDGRCEGPYTQTYLLEEDGSAGCMENLRPQISFSGYCEGDNVNFHGFFDSGTCDGTPDWVSYDDSNRISGYGLAGRECSRDTFAAGTDPDYGMSSYQIEGEAGGWLPCPVVSEDCWTVPEAHLCATTWQFERRMRDSMGVCTPCNGVCGLP